MEKILRRTAYAKTYRARQLTRERAGRAKLRRTLLIGQNSQYAEERAKAISAYRVARREDWFLGPLAPRRDAGGEGETYATRSTRFLNGVEKIEKSGTYWGISPGDRVAVTGEKERERGKIGIVREVRKKAEEVVIERVNMADVAVPPHMLVTDPDKTPTRTIEFPIPLSSVRLIHPIKDPTTGQTKDTIIASLSPISNCPTNSLSDIHDLSKARHLAKRLKRAQELGIETPDDLPPLPRSSEPRTPNNKTKRPRRVDLSPRFITNTSTFIPRPPPPKRPEFETYPSDTPTEIVEATTWVPLLRQEPQPGSLIDELRNKYSKFRDRHDPSYIRHHEQKAAKEERRVERKRGAMRSPIEEMRVLKERERGVEKEKVVEEPSSELLEGIGRLMAANKGGWMERAGQRGRDVGT